MQKISKDTFWSSGSKMQAHQLIACRVHAHNLRPMYALIDFSAIQTPAQPGDANAALRVAFGAPCEVLKTHELHQVKAVLEAVEQRARCRPVVRGLCVLRGGARV
jgi:hypothetical protein